MKTASSSSLRVAIFAIVALLLQSTIAHATPSPTIAPDLAGIPGEHGWKLINRAARVVDRDGGVAVRLEGDDGTGFARLENVTFADGEIESCMHSRLRPDTPKGPASALW